MEVRMESKKGNVVTGIDPVLTQIQQRLEARPKEWLVALQQDPGKFADLEKEIHRAFAQMADQVVAGLLAETTADSDFAAAAKKSNRCRPATAIAWRRAKAFAIATPRRLAVLGNNPLLQPGLANRQGAWPRGFGVVSGVGNPGLSRRQEPGLGARGGSADGALAIL